MSGRQRSAVSWISECSVPKFRNCFGFEARAQRRLERVASDERRDPRAGDREGRRARAEGPQKERPQLGERGAVARVLAQERLDAMIAQRDELTEAIGDLTAEIDRVGDMLVKRGVQRKAAE